MAGLDAARLVFVDECGTHTSMTRLDDPPEGPRRARVRARGAVPRNRGPVTTLLAASAWPG
jgi:hypothetical protein